MQIALDAGQLVDLLHEVDGQPDRAGLVGHAARDGLPDPPRGVRGELEALGVVELLDRLISPRFPSWMRSSRGHPAAGVALGQRDDQAQVRLQQVVTGPPAVPDDRAQVAGVGGVELGALLPRDVEHVLREDARLDALGELDLLRRGEQGGLADAVEVHADEVGRRALGVEVFLSELDPGLDGGSVVSGGRSRYAVRGGSPYGRPQESSRKSSQQSSRKWRHGMSRCRAPQYGWLRRGSGERSW